MSRALRITVGLLIGAGSAAAQQQQGSSATKAKPVLGSADYANWETLGNGALSPDGKWVAYDFRRGNGSTELRYRMVDSDNEHGSFGERTSIQQQRPLAHLHDHP
jgi:hypothetical protein